MENTHNNNKSPPRSSPNLSPLKIEFKNPIVTNKSTLATSSSPTSSDLSPLSSHDDNPPPSDSPLCHVSPSPDPAEEEKTKKPSVITEGEFRLARSLSSASSELSPLSSLGHENNNPAPLDSPPYHVSPSPRPKVRQFLSVARAEKREKTVKRAALGFRVFGLGFCLVSLAVMAADKDRGWALDSFYRYKEFRYCISVNVVGFLYSVAQTCDLAFTLCTGKYVLRHQYRFYFDFVMDQILTYLLMSASSSAATRVDDWESNWGKDEFPMMASISVGLSFMSFAALAASTLISGYALCTWSSS